MVGTSNNAKIWYRGALVAFVPVSLVVLILVYVGGGYTLESEQGLVAYYMQRHRHADSPLYYLDALPYSARFYSHGTATAVTQDELNQYAETKHYKRYFIALPLDWTSGKIKQMFGNSITEMQNSRYQLISVDTLQQPGLIAYE